MLDQTVNEDNIDNSTYCPPLYFISLCEADPVSMGGISLM